MDPTKVFLNEETEEHGPFEIEPIEVADQLTTEEVVHYKDVIEPAMEIGNVDHSFDPTDITLIKPELVLNDVRVIEIETPVENHKDENIQNFINNPDNQPMPSIDPFEYVNVPAPVNVKYEPLVDVSHIDESETEFHLVNLTHDHNSEEDGELHYRGGIDFKSIHEANT